MTYARRISTNTLQSGKYAKHPAPSSSHSSGHYSPSRVDFIDFFYAVLRRWESETAFCSDPDKITGHPSFVALVQNAELVTHLIIHELQTNPSMLVWVLNDAYGEKPYASDALGNITEMTNAWISWAERNGRIL